MFKKVILFLTILLISQPVRANERHALVIGNSNYKSAPLKNPKNDAALMTRVLQNSGFSVKTVYNGPRSEILEAVRAFSRNLKEGVGLLYYAGHAVQHRNENYLLPIRASINRPSDIPLEAVRVSDLLQSMERSSGRVNIIILDACRNDPFASSTRSFGRGLAPVRAPAGSLVAFATAPGSVAMDGSGSNSPYTAALAKVILSKKRLSIEQVFKLTRISVIEQSGGAQVPWENSSLTGDFFFNSKGGRGTKAELPPRIIPKKSQTIGDMLKKHGVEISEGQPVYARPPNRPKPKRDCFVFNGQKFCD